MLAPGIRWDFFDIVERGVVVLGQQPLDVAVLGQQQQQQVGLG